MFKKIFETATLTLIALVSLLLIPIFIVILPAVIAGLATNLLGIPPAVAIPIMFLLIFINLIIATLIKMYLDKFPEL